MLVLEHGKPMIFGKDRDKGIRLNGLHPEVVTIGAGRRDRGGPARPRRAGRGPVPRADPVAHVLAGLPGPGRRPARDRPADPRPPARGPAGGRRRQVRAGRPRAGAAMAARPGRSSRRRRGRHRRGAGSGWRRHALPVVRLREPDRRRHLRQLRRGHLRPRHPAPGAGVPRASCWASISTGSARRRRSPSRRTRRSTSRSPGCTKPRPTASSSWPNDRLVGIFTDRDAVVKAAGKRLDVVPRPRLHDPRPGRPPPRRPDRGRDPQDGRRRVPPHPDRRGRPPDRRRHRPRRLPPPRVVDGPRLVVTGARRRPRPGPHLGRPPGARGRGGRRRAGPRRTRSSGSTGALPGGDRGDRRPDRPAYDGVAAIEAARAGGRPRARRRPARRPRAAQARPRRAAPSGSTPTASCSRTGRPRSRRGSSATTPVGRDRLGDRAARRSRPRATRSGSSGAAAATAAARPRRAAHRRRLGPALPHGLRGDAARAADHARRGRRQATPFIVVPRLERARPRPGLRTPVEIRDLGRDRRPVRARRGASSMHVAGRASGSAVSDTLIGDAPPRGCRPRSPPTATYESASTVLRELRMVKDADEIALLRLAAQAADRVVAQIAGGPAGRADRGGRRPRGPRTAHRRGPRGGAFRDRRLRAELGVAASRGLGAGDQGRASRSCSTSAARSAATARTSRGRCG